MSKYFAIFLLCLSQLSFSAEQTTPSTPDAALQRLMEGNTRFMSGKSIHKNLALEKLSELKDDQAPFAVVVGCSDSRVPPELIFDQGVGDIFVVRIAGNVIGPTELDSVEYAAVHLRSSIVIVLGHENCGAVKASLLGQDNVPELKNIYPLIAPALKKCQAKKGDLLANAIKCNAMEGVNYLKTVPSLANLIAAKQLKVVGGYYDFHQGKVSLIED